MEDDQRFFRPIWDDFDGELFQDLVVDLLTAEDYRVEASGVGPDGGVDAFATEQIRCGFNNPEPFTWAVQCKFTSAERAISPRDVGEILNVVSDERFVDKKIAGYLLATNGRLSTNMMTQLRGLGGRLPGFKTTYVDRSRIHDLLIKHKSVYKKYFWATIEERAIAADERFASDPVKLLEKMVNDDHTSEADISAFFQAHPQCLARPLGLNGAAFAQVRLGSDYLVDFLLEPRANEPWVIVELRSPTQKLFVKQGGNVRFSATTMQSIAQLCDFGQFFADTNRREDFSARFGAEVFKPRLVVIIGRNYGGLTDSEIIELKSHAQAFEVLTYEDVLGRLRDSQDTV